MARQPDKGDDGLTDIQEEIKELIDDLKETLPNNVSVWDNQERETT